MQLHEKSLAERLALSVDVVRTSGLLKRGGMVDPVKNAVSNPPEVTKSDKLRWNRATSSFSIIVSRIFEDSFTLITTVTKRFLIFRNNCCDVQWQGHKKV